jgi:farnesyl diphosphate synthase
MAFSQRLAAVAGLIETKLTALLDAEAAFVAPPRLIAAMRHGTLAGGKRLRPFFVLEGAALFGLEPKAALDTAAAVELVHCYSLIHDDLPAMDNDDLRRGKPTVHKSFDEWTAILAGDALLTLAFETLLAKSESNPDVAISLARGLARASGARGMAGGQCLDLEAEKLGQPVRPTRAHVERLQTMKTGALLLFSCQAGAILAKATAEKSRALTVYGERLGLAFQVADDLLDLEGDAATVGKAVGKDAAKATLHAADGVEAARARLAALEAEAIAALAPFGSAADTLREAAKFVIRREK